MLQHEANFHDDVKLVLVFSLITRLMLRNVQRSPIGKKNFPSMMSKAYSTYAVLEDRERFFCTALPQIQEFADKLFSGDMEEEFVDSIAEISRYIIAHAQDSNLHETIAVCTSPSYKRGELKRAWEAARDGKLDFETWYNSQV